MKRMIVGLAAACIAGALALHAEVAAPIKAGIVAPEVENMDKAYGELFGRVVARVRLWPGLAPHESDDCPGVIVRNEKKKIWLMNRVSLPQLVIVAPTAEKRLDTVVLAMAGGGYSTQNISSLLANCRPVLDSGRWLAVLHYRVPRRKGREIYAAPREDAARAIRFLRANAAKFGWSPEKIGAVGFSAGGHLAAISATSSQDELYGRVDDLDDVSAHLNFAIPVYPAYVLDDGKTGRNAQGGDGAAILPEFKFDDRTPPMFLVHGDRDFYSPMASIRLYSELHRRKIPAQLFVYANASHGLGGDNVNVRGWQARIVDWIASIGF